MMQSNDEIYIKLNGIFRDIFDNESITVTPETNSETIEDWGFFESHQFSDSNRKRIFYSICIGGARRSKKCR